MRKATYTFVIVEILRGHKEERGQYTEFSKAMQKKRELEYQDTMKVAGSYKYPNSRFEITYGALL